MGRIPRYTGVVAGVAAAEGVGIATGLRAGVRFPNDVYLVGRKLGGILVETARVDESRFIIPLIGIGINVNVPEFPPELRERAISTLLASGREFPVGAVTGHILRRLGDLWDDLSDDAFAEILLPRWQTLADPENCRTFRVDGRDLYCRVVDVAGDGAVTLEDGNGERHRTHAAQVILGGD